MMTLLCAPLIACASPEPSVHVPADLVRASCRPSPALMVEPKALPAIKPGDRMVEVSARDSALYNALRRLTIDLQAHIREFCQ